MGRKYLGPALYWRVLRDGKYTWKKAEIDYIDATMGYYAVLPLEVEE